MIHELKPGGTFLLNCAWTAEQLEERIPAKVKRYMAENGVQFYIVDANHIAHELGLGDKSNMILQAAFFNLAKVIPVEDAVRYMKEAAQKTFAKKGEKIVNMNLAAVDAGINSPVRVQIPDSWRYAEEPKKELDQIPAMIRDIVMPINAQRGDDLPVSAFVGHEGGTFTMGTSVYEKRGIATNLPVWDPAKCIQCNRCAYVCPHAAIRPFLLDEREAAEAPDGFEMLPASGAKGYHFALQVSTMDCTGCGSCAASCPAKEKALAMVPAAGLLEETGPWQYALTVSDGQGKPVPPAPSGVLRGLRRLRPDALCQIDHPTLRRQGILGQCHRLFHGLERGNALVPLYQKSGGKGSQLCLLPV